MITFILGVKHFWLPRSIMLPSEFMFQACHKDLVRVSAARDTPGTLTRGAVLQELGQIC